MAKAQEIASEFPRLRARLDRAEEIGYATAPERSFDFGLEAILDGIESRLAALQFVVVSALSTDRSDSPCTWSCDGRSVLALTDPERLVAKERDPSVE
jgi:hypothetical protein